VDRSPPNKARTKPGHPIAARLVGWLLVLVAVFAPVLSGQPARADVRPDRMTERSSERSPLDYHFPTQYAPAIDLLDKNSDKIVGRLAGGLGIESFPTVQVWVLPQVDDYFELNGRPDRSPKWAIGLSLGDQRTVIVARDTRMPGQAQDDIDKTFVHELTHVAIDIASRGHHVPHWFNEGYALMQAAEWTPERAEKLSRAAATGALIPLHQLNASFPNHQNVASLAYAESFDFVRFIQKRHGDRAIAGIMDDVGRGIAFDKAVDRSTGESLASLEGAWRKGLSDNTSWVALLRDDFTIFFGMALIFAIGWFVRRRRNNQKYESLDEGAGQWDYDDSRYPLPGESGDS